MRTARQTPADAIRNKINALFPTLDSLEPFRQFVENQEHRRNQIAVYRQDARSYEPPDPLSVRYDWHRHEWRSELFRDYVKNQIGVRLPKCGIHQYIPSDAAEWTELPTPVNIFHINLSGRVRELLEQGLELERVILDRYGERYKKWRVRGDLLQERTGVIAQFSEDNPIPFALLVPKTLVLEVLNRTGKERANGLISAQETLPFYPDG